ncbi:MAG: hypothetical protein ACYDD4_02730 [Acidimicrobiales bacterium]
MAQRLRAQLAAGAGMLALAAGLSGCANARANGLVGQACVHVEASLRLYRASVSAPPDVQMADQAAALAQLRLALPIAAQAAGESPQWQAFMTTLSESSRVPESDLVQALSDQCANSGTPPAPASSTVPPTLPGQ